MGKLIRMDLYRMFKSKTFFVCLILSFVLALAIAPLEKLLFNVASMISEQNKKTETRWALSDEAYQRIKEQAGVPEEVAAQAGEAMSWDAMTGEEKQAMIQSGFAGEGDFTEITVEVSDSSLTFAKTAELGSIIQDPFLLVNAMLILISAGSFFYADVEGGYIKNIAGQMSRKGYTVASKFMASIPHNLLFMLAGVLGNLLGSLLVRTITGSGVMTGIGVFFLKLLLLQAVCALQILFVSTLRNKSLGMVVAVVMGMGLLGLFYSLIDTGIQKLLPDAGDIFSKYMPDVLMLAAKPDALPSVVVSVVFIGVFLNLAVWLFDKKDVT